MFPLSVRVIVLLNTHNIYFQDTFTPYLIASIIPILKCN